MKFLKVPLWLRVKIKHYDLIVIFLASEPILDIYTCFSEVNGFKSEKNIEKLKVMLLQPSGFKSGPLINMSYDSCKTTIENEQRTKQNQQKVFKIEAMRDVSKILFIYSVTKIVIYDMESFEINDSFDFSYDTADTILDFTYNKKYGAVYVLTDDRKLHFIRVSKKEERFKIGSKYTWQLRSKDLLNLNETNELNLRSKDLVLSNMAVNNEGESIILSGYFQVKKINNISYEEEYNLQDNISLSGQSGSQITKYFDILVALKYSHQKGKIIQKFVKEFNEERQRPIDKLTKKPYQLTQDKKLHKLKENPYRYLRFLGGKSSNNFEDVGYNGKNYRETLIGAKIDNLSISILEVDFKEENISELISDYKMSSEMMLYGTQVQNRHYFLTTNKNLLMLDELSDID